MVNTLSYSAIIPHKNIIYDLKQIQKFFINSNSECVYFPFLPFCALLPDNTSTENLLPPLYIHQPVFDNKWLYCPLSFSKTSTSFYKDYFSNSDFNKNIKLASLPEFPKKFCIPLVFSLRKTNATNNEKIINTDSVKGSYGKISFPLKLRIFRTAKLNFTWPLDENSIKTLQEKYKAKFPDLLPYAFNWSLSENKWKK